LLALLKGEKITLTEKILVVEGLKMHFPLEAGLLARVFGSNRVVHALDGVDLEVNKGETLGVVGESGCGKSTLARCIVRMYEPTDGKILYRGENVLDYNRGETRRYRTKVQMIFQDPYSSLDPRVPVRKMLVEILENHGLVKTKQEKEARIVELMQSVGLDVEHLNRFPHEFSGGQRQRLCIARALAVEPEIIIADESVSALDVSIQAQTLNLFEELQSRLGLTFIFISHDLSVVGHISHRVAVMYLGKVVEVAEGEELFRNPGHPYTQALISAVPVPDPDIVKEEIILKGDVPTPVDVPPGCRFHPRCPYVMDVCRRIEPELLKGVREHEVACHLVNPVLDTQTKA
jgi:oligopeptide/dipeptide ABC transporter ATP-binding protein